MLFCGDPHGQWQHIIDAALKTHACAVILLGHLEPARLLNIEREAIWERVWFIHGHHDTDHGFKALDTLARRMGVRMTAHGHQHDNIDSSAQWDAQGFQSFGVGLRGVMAVDGLD